MKLKLDREHLTQSQIAALMAVDERTLRRWEAEYPDGRRLPRNADGTYHFDAVFWWAVANKVTVNRSQQSNARRGRRLPR
jgi:transcriptional regulator with XRE-family HTH domain